jgi:hypothetical protein
MSLDLPILRKGSFYFIKDEIDNFILEDKTKRGLSVKETSIDDQLQVKSDKGMIHDMDGIGHWVSIRWYFPKKLFTIIKVSEYAETLEQKYTKLRELTCPDYDD